VRRRRALGALGCLAAWLAGCASSRDPLEGMNRGTFWFNEQLDRFVLAPAGRGWSGCLPDAAERAVRRFFANLGLPVVFLNDLLQAKPLAAGQDLSRLAINTTVGVAGLFDPATALGLPRHDEDLDQTLGRWGLPMGPYLVLPLFGPSSPRGVLGLVGDSAANPTLYLLPPAGSAAVAAVDRVSWRAENAAEIEQLRDESVDYYAAVRNLYLENRACRVEDCTEEEAAAGAVEEDDEEELDLYFPEDAEEETP
jgi:phospholipid-binding lipoprotein MlaA